MPRGKHVYFPTTDSEAVVN